MSKNIDIEDIKNLVNECVKNNKIDFLCNLVYVLQNNYKDLAKLATDGSYHEGWSHSQVIDFLTYESH